MKHKRIFLGAFITLLAGLLSFSFINNKDYKEVNAADFNLSGDGDKFKLIDRYYQEDESFVYSADLHFRSGQAGGIAFGSEENDRYYVLTMDRFLNRVKLIYFASNHMDGYVPTEIKTDYFIGNDKITEHELALVNPKVATIENVNLKVVLTREDEHAYVECYVEGIKRFGNDATIDLNEYFTYQGGYIGMNCFSSDIYLTDMFYDTSDYTYFSENYRNQYHLQPFSKWSNDPNGLCYYKGYYHVFYQTYPFSNYWGDMYWGHARSRDLIHFEFLPICLFPDTEAMGFGPGNGYMWSGCAMVYTHGMSNDIDELNWFPNGNGDGLLAFYTRAGDLQDQVIMSSDDEGLTWTKRIRIPQSISGFNDWIDFRDPKVFPVRTNNQGHVEIWGMTLSSMNSEARNTGWFLASYNLIDWFNAGKFNFPAPECIGVGYLQNELGQTKAYLTNKSRQYIFGTIAYDDYNSKILFTDLDGYNISNYSLEQMNEKLKPVDYGNDSYASQSFYINDPASDYYGKDIVLNWFAPEPSGVNPTKQEEYLGLRGRWSGGFTIPVEYGMLYTNEEGYRLTQKPITVNNENLEKHEVINITSEALTNSSDNPLKSVATHVFELSADIKTFDNSPIVFKVDIGGNDDYMEFGWNSVDGYYIDRTHLNDKGINVNSDWHKKYSSGVIGDSTNKTFYVLSDNGGLEVFCENYSVSFYVLTTAGKEAVYASLSGDSLLINSLVINEIESAYQTKRVVDKTHYIEMNADAFSNFDFSEGKFASAGAGYWNENYSFHALDTFFRGETGSASSNLSLMLKPWKQKTQYVYFTWGGAHDSNYNYLKFYCGNNNEYTFNMYNEAFLGNAMMLNYFKIPDIEFASLMSKYPTGFDMKIELVDTKPGIDDYAFHNFGYLHINQTLEDTSRAMYYYINYLDENRSEIDAKDIQCKYYENSDLREVFYHAFTNIDEDFESQSAFERNWFFDKTYYSDAQNKPRHMANAISCGEYRPGDSRMPFNKTGKGFFRGWYEDNKDSGFIGGDTAVYRFISHPVTLTGDCIVSVKMAGTASLHVLDASINPGKTKDSDIAWINNRVYSTNGSEIITNGFNTCTMVRHVINLSAFEGKTIQLAICDYSSGGWGAAYFDELKVNFDLETTGFGLDLVTQNHINGNSYKMVYIDRYINTSDISSDANGIEYVKTAVGSGFADSSAAIEAYGFINSYFDYARSSAGQANICDNDIRKSGTMKGLINTYNSLSTSAKKIICASNDYQRDREGSWATADATIFNLGESLWGIASDNNMSITVYNVNEAHLIDSFIFRTDSDTQVALIVTIIISLIFALALFAFMKYKNK